MERFFGTANSPAMQEIFRTLEKIAPSDLSFVIVGEHGTGKEWIARTIHQMSGRHRGPFWPVDCSSLMPENIEKEIFGYEAVTREGISLNRGAFEDASGGTLLLNEIESLPHAIQLKVARALEYQIIRRAGEERDVRINVRVIATMTESPDILLKKGSLMKEVFYRLSPIVLELPPLRERREDIPILIETILTDLHSRNNSSVLGITPQALHLCLEHDWPGNIRNLRNAVEYASVMCTGKFIQPEDLPRYLLGNSSSKKHLAVYAGKKS